MSRLSSKDYQDRVVFSGDKDNYVLVDELIEDALYWSRRVISNSETHLDAMQEITALIFLLTERCSEINNMSNYDIINNSDFWNDVRALTLVILEKIHRQ